ncbi:hypothetical protein ABIB62_003271 [Mucilaginibacter sp. UYP25]|uniref:hypothetical protein n=1 Tax=unclassified Mucilaginibacter TaxID=2617802 RepID=UPI00339392E7
MNEDFDELIIAQAVKTSGNLEVAFKTYQLWQDILDRLVSVFFVKLKTQLLTTLPTVSGGWTIELTEPSNMKTAMNISLANSDWKDITFGIGDYDGDRVHFFIKSEAENRMELYQYVTDKINGKTNLDIWYQKTIMPYNTWESTIAGIMAVYQSEQLVDYCTSKLSELATYIGEYLTHS